ncbi:hypothetical protein BMS3Abin08_00368 [bacterium BMS3Abin08]|nr:hypothetical protein BMS3Abin08_00368 [bacterium BMS3Abin08]
MACRSGVEDNYIVFIGLHEVYEPVKGGHLRGAGTAEILFQGCNNILGHDLPVWADYPLFVLPGCLVRINLHGIEKSIFTLRLTPSRQ